MHRRKSKLSLTDSIEKWKIPYLDIIAVGTVQFLLAPIILCYGVYLMTFVLKEGYSLKTGLWTVITFVSTSKITSPWIKFYCEHLDSIEHRVHKRNIVIATLFLSVALITASLINRQSVQIVSYGAFGGFFSTFIHVHLKFSTSDTFSNRRNFYENLNQIVQPLCLILTPHFVLFLTKEYVHARSQLILSGIILNIIPFCLLTKSRSYQKMALCKFQTVERLAIEMTELSPKAPAVIESSSSSEESDGEGETEPNSEPTVHSQPSSTVQVYYQNVGVKILPNIPEEDESEAEDDINEISSKRLSRISAILQGLNESGHKDLSSSINNLYQPDEVGDNVESKEDEITDYPEEFRLKKNRCFRLNSNTIYTFMRRREKFKNFLKEYFTKSILTALTRPSFYPAVVSNSVITFISIIIFATNPYVMLEKNQNQNLTALDTTDATFLLTIIGFAWLFFLCGYPVYNKLSDFKIKVLFLIGLSLSGFSLYVAQRFDYNFTLFSLLFGLGYGIVNYTEHKTYEEFFGSRNWKNSQAALEISVGFIVILAYLIIYLSDLNIDVLLTYAYWPYVCVISLWIFAFILKRIIVQMKTIRRYNHEKYSTFAYF